MRERRRRLASLALTAAFVLLAVPAGATEPTRGLPSRLRVLVPADEMPEMFSFESKGQPGFERELVEGFCRIHGLALDVVPVRDFDQIIPMLLAGLRAGRVDAIVMTVFDFALAKKRDPDLVAGAFVGPAAAAALAVRRDDGRLLEALNGYLLGMRQARQSLMFKYVSEEALSLIAQARRE
jgi:ABC-type amino acid transport substrate-binding protein